MPKKQVFRDWREAEAHKARLHEEAEASRQHPNQHVKRAIQLVLNEQDRDAAALAKTESRAARRERYLSKKAARLFGRNEPGQVVAGSSVPVGHLDPVVLRVRGVWAYIVGGHLGSPPTERSARFYSLIEYERGSERVLVAVP